MYLGQILSLSKDLQPNNTTPPHVEPHASEHHQQSSCLPTDNGHAIYMILEFVLHENIKTQMA